MIEKIYATLVSNAGILIRYKDIKILVDGLYDDKGHVFSRMPPKIEAMVMNGDAPFDHIDYLFFSHRHLDHYCERKAIAYLKKHSVKRIFLPQECVEGRPIRDFFAAAQIVYTPLSKATDGKVFHLNDYLDLQFQKTRHLSETEDAVQHFCCQMTFDKSKKILLTSDMDYIYTPFQGILSEKQAVTFVNPMFMSAIRGKKFYHGGLKTEYIVVYHLPFAEDDDMNLRNLVENTIRWWHKSDGEPVIFREALETRTF
jgi:L-ascorbate metabolism protein UlaG (beta-lactamase superfamily)